LTERETRNPKPETRNQKPETRNPKPGTRNPEPGIRNSKPENLLQGYYKEITQEYDGKGDKMKLAADIQQFISSVLGPKSETRNLKHETRQTKHEARKNPKS